MRYARGSSPCFPRGAPVSRARVSWGNRAFVIPFSTIGANRRQPGSVCRAHNPTASARTRRLCRGCADGSRHSPVHDAHPFRRGVCGAWGATAVTQEGSTVAEEGSTAPSVRAGSGLASPHGRCNPRTASAPHAAVPSYPRACPPPAPGVLQDQQGLHPRVPQPAGLRARPVPDARWAGGPTVASAGRPSAGGYHRQHGCGGAAAAGLGSACDSMPRDPRVIAPPPLHIAPYHCLQAWRLPSTCSTSRRVLAGGDAHAGDGLDKPLGTAVADERRTWTTFLTFPFAALSLPFLTHRRTISPATPG